MELKSQLATKNGLQQTPKNAGLQSAVTQLTRS